MENKIDNEENAIQSKIVEETYIEWIKILLTME
jgi:hypothetical protein